MLCIEQIQWKWEWIFLITSVILIQVYILIRKFSKKQNVKYKTVPGKSENYVLPYMKLLCSIIIGRELPEKGIKLLCVLLKIHQKSGICLMNFPFLKIVFIYRPDIVKVLLQDIENNSKSILYSFMKEWLGSSLLLRDGERWRQRRKLLTPTFHFQILESFLPIIEKHSRNLVVTLQKHQEEQWIDVVPCIAECIMNILCETAMGLRNSHKDYCLLYQKTLSNVCDIIQQRMFQLHLWPNFLFYFSKKRRELIKNIKILRDITNEIIREKLKEIEENSNIDFRKERRLAFLDLLLDCLKTDPNFTMTDVYEEVQLFLFGGNDTSAVTLSWALHLLGKHDSIQTKVRKELDEIMGKDISRCITKDDLQKMKYLECVIKETLRIQPTVPFLSRKLTKDVIVNDYKIYGGSLCIIPVFIMHRDAELFPNPKVFDPDRFLPENCTTILPYSYIPFSAGPRNCLGQKFAMMEMKIVLATIIRSFNLRSLDETIPASYKLVNHPKGPVKIKMIPRNFDR